MSQERNITNDLKSATGADRVAPFVAFFGDFPIGNVRIWTGMGDLVFGGNTYLGMGEFLAADVVPESIDGSAEGISVTLSGIPSLVLDAVTIDNYHGRAATMYLGCLDVETGAVISDPVTLFSGFMDSDEVKDDGATSTVTIRAEHRLSDLLRRREYRYTLKSQHALRGATTDLGLEFIPTLQEAQIQWGQI